MVADSNYTSYGEYCVMHIVIESLCRTPEKNILHINCISVNNFKIENLKFFKIKKKRYSL